MRRPRFVDLLGPSTVTVFAIPSGKAHLRDGSERMRTAIGEALVAADYRPVARRDRPGGPVLECRVSRMNFKT